MSFSIVIFGFLTFFIAFCLHVFIWRVFKPKNQMTVIFTIFLFIPFILFLAILPVSGFTSLFDFLAVALLYFSLSCAYIQTYPVIYVYAPSLQIVHIISKSNEGGLSFLELENHFNNSGMLDERLNDLLVEKFVFYENEKLLLTLKGKFLATVFYYFRKLYGLKPGEG